MNFHGGTLVLHYSGNDPVSVSVGNPLRFGEITVPSAYVSNGFSLPAWSVWCLDPFGRGMRAAVIHDYLYEYNPRDESRSVADRIFRQAMWAAGVPLWRRWLYWLAVRIAPQARQGWRIARCANPQPLVVCEIVPPESIETETVRL